MKPSALFKSNIKGILIIYAVIPVGLFILSLLSYYMNPNIEQHQLKAMLYFILLLTVILFLLAWCVSWRRIEFYEEKIVIKKIFQKQEVVFLDIKKAIESEIEGKFGQGKVKTFCLMMKNKETLHVPSKPFDQSKEAILQLINKHTAKK